MPRSVRPLSLEFTPERKATFLEHVAKGFSIHGACRKVNVTPPTIYNHRNKDPDFAALLVEAVKLGTQYMEDEARRRAIEGVRKVRSQYYLGEKVGEDVTREYSDLLLIFLLKARDPEKYRERQDVHHTGDVTVRRYIGIDPEEV